MTAREMLMNGLSLLRPVSSALRQIAIGRICYSLRYQPVQNQN